MEAQRERLTPCEGRRGWKASQNLSFKNETPKAEAGGAGQMFKVSLGNVARPPSQIISNGSVNAFALAFAPASTPLVFSTM